MRKQWIKPENIYYKPFYKQKDKMFLLLLILFGGFFLIYQILFVSELQVTSQQPILQPHIQPQLQDSELRSRKKPLKGYLVGMKVRDREHHLRDDGNFACVTSGKTIPMNWVNDDYCDCPEDGSDEPNTNACPIGLFHCKKYAKSHRRTNGIPRSWLNDGICDCCDGEDEFTTSVNCKYIRGC